MKRLIITLIFLFLITTISANTIYLNSINSSKTSDANTETIKTQNHILYESKTEMIKQYSMLGFAFLCIILTILISWNKLN